ncbi:unnamed protein product, partial [Allacma fusca]
LSQRIKVITPPYPWVPNLLPLYCRPNNYFKRRSSV